MRAGLKALGFNMGPSVTPIIPIHTGDVATTILAWKKCFDAGLYTNAVLAPAVPPDRVPAAHVLYGHPHRRTDRSGDRDLGEVGRELGLIN